MIKHAENFVAPNLFQAILVLLKQGTESKELRRGRRWWKCEKKGSYQWRRKIVSAGGGCRDSEDQRIRRVSKNSEDRNAGVLKKIEGHFILIILA